MYWMDYKCEQKLYKIIMFLDLYLVVVIFFFALVTTMGILYFFGAPGKSTLAELLLVY